MNCSETGYPLYEAPEPDQDDFCYCEEDNLCGNCRDALTRGRLMRTPMHIPSEEPPFVWGPGDRPVILQEDGAPLIYDDFAVELAIDDAKAAAPSIPWTIGTTAPVRPPHIAVIGNGLYVRTRRAS